MMLPLPQRNVKLTLLGTGTSQGVPVIGCRCAVCTSSDPRDNRLRTSALLSDGTTNILIDPGPDFRQQMLRAQVDHLDAILITHEHNDHVIGIDDVRPFNFASGQAMRVYALPRVAADMRYRFQYIFGVPIPGLPRVELIDIEQDSEIVIGTCLVQAIGIQHGRLPILGFRVGNLAYITDMKTIAPSEAAKLEGIDTLVVNALQHHEHPTHMTLEQAVLFVAQVRPRQAFLTHASHLLGLAAEVEPTLPPGISLGYDGLEVFF